MGWWNGLRYAIRVGESSSPIAGFMHETPARRYAGELAADSAIPERIYLVDTHEGTSKVIEHR